MAGRLAESGEGAHALKIARAKKPRHKAGEVSGVIGFRLARRVTEM